MLQSYPCTRSYPAIFPWTVFTTCYLGYISITYSGSPESTGWRDIRADTALKDEHTVENDIKDAESVSTSISSNIIVAGISQIVATFGGLVRRYFSGRVISASGDLDSSHVYVFGFHPHGVVPVTLFWMITDRVWDRLFPGITVSVLTASVMHMVPLLRDMLQWAGGREITRETFRNTLREGLSCVVVPGGQAEMMESRSRDRDIRVVTKHNGYIRMAIQEGAWLVPVFSFGEVDIMDNVRIPTIQRWFLKRFGASIPHYPYGYYGLPIPRRVPVTVVIGEAIPTERKTDPTTDEVNQLLIKYMQSLKDLFERYREEAGESPERRLVFVGADEKEIDLSVMSNISTAATATNSAVKSADRDVSNACEKQSQLVDKLPEDIIDDSQKSCIRGCVDIGSTACVSTSSLSSEVLPTSFYEDERDGFQLVQSKLEAAS
eukprot:CAMPEP_0182437554 /NCGR_PEP_ID=MMETSP1167-20130531/85124_1 /TAXON_ID=2988 /ORGANISM="Mallomonas Sp, Strain CCMP3275" /LENGTH=433 /DNA_ID=CAMNT_0024630511 /DNA_START=1870 /DNA_END=3171 /DNA_ORIENTATION=-